MLGDRAGGRLMLDDERDALAAACHRLAEAGMAVGTAGNLSIRTGEHVVITPTGLTLRRATPLDMTVVDLDGTVVEGRFAPTSEMALHLGIYRAGPAGAVAHAHPPAATAVSCTVPVLPALHYSVASFGGPVRVAPYATFGTRELADVVVAALDGRTAALMANHGAVALGADLDQACDRLEHLEWLAHLHCTVFGPAAPRVLTEAELSDVTLSALQRGYGAPRELDPATTEKAGPPDRHGQRR